eukprot:30879-Pelagococcus_subviridis.AAC.5
MLQRPLVRLPLERLVRRHAFAYHPQVVPQERAQRDHEDVQERGEAENGREVPQREPREQRVVLGELRRRPVLPFEPDVPQASSRDFISHARQRHRSRVRAHDDVYREEAHEIPQVILPDRVVHPPAEVVEPRDASFRDPAVLGPRGRHHP